jgi:hypothetical protein
LLAVARDSEKKEGFKVMSSPSRVPNMPSHKAQAGRGGKRPPRRWLTLAIAPLFIFAGITFLIETKKGQLVIESEVDDVSIRLLREGEQVDELQIKTGNESTRLTAGKYEVVIASASDQVVVDQDKFQIKSGDTVIVRVKRIVKLSETTNTTSPPKVAGPLEPTYNGRTFAQWSQQYRQERHAESIEEALTAIYALRSQTSPQKLTELLLDAGGGHRRNWQDTTLPHLLQLANSGTSYFQLLVDVLDQTDASEQGRILQYAFTRGDVSGGVIKPLVQWIVKNAPLKESQSGGSLSLRLDELMRSLLTRLEGEDFQYLVDQISNCDAFGDKYFLQVMPTERDSIELQKHVRNVALDSIRNEQTSAVDVTLAALILASHSFPTADSLAIGDGDQSFNEQLGDAVYERLMSLANDKQRMLASVNLPDRFSWPRIEQKLFLPAKIRLAGRPREFMETLSLAYLASSTCTVEDRTKCFELLAERTQSQWTTAVEKSAGYTQLYIERWNPMVATWTSNTRKVQPAIGLDAENWIGLLIHEFVLRFLDAPLVEKEMSIDFNLDPKYTSYAQRIIGRYDKNQDGSLSEDEYSKMLMSPLDADLDKDGKIDVIEYARWMSERSKK